jgi:ribose/xylose/arabinose/galactoside ABC-type transport system permease subunit
MRLRAGRKRVPQGPTLALLMVLVMIVIPALTQGSIQERNVLNIFQSLTFVAPLAIAVGLTMILGEFDISVVSTAALGGMLSIKLGNSAGIAVGVIAAALAGLILGAIQGYIIARFQISSVPVTLGGFLAIWGLTEIVGGGKQIVLENPGVSEGLTKVVGGVFTVGALIVIGGVLVIDLILGSTRLGRNVRAVGGDSRAANLSGIPGNRVIIGTFAAGGLIAALGGVLGDFSNSVAEPTVSFGPLVTAVIAAIVGGVAITGANGSAFGIACGVLVIAMLEETLLITETDPNLATVITGAFLAMIAVISAPELARSLRWSTRFQKFRTPPDEQRLEPSSAAGGRV